MLRLNRTPDLIPEGPMPELWLVLVVVAALAAVLFFAGVLVSRTALPLSALLMRCRWNKPRHRSAKQKEPARQAG